MNPHSISIFNTCIEISKAHADFVIAWLLSLFRHAQAAYGEVYNPHQVSTYRKRCLKAYLATWSVFMVVSLLFISIVALTINWFSGRYGLSVWPFLVLPSLWITLAPTCWRFLYRGTLIYFAKVDKTA